MSKTAIRPKTPLDILRARIAETYVATDSLGLPERYIKIATVTLPLWVAEELKQALEKQ